MIFFYSDAIYGAFLSYLNDPAVLTADLINFKGTSVLMIHNNKRNEEVTDTLSVNNGIFTVTTGLIPDLKLLSYILLSMVGLMMVIILKQGALENTMPFECR